MVKSRPYVILSAAITLDGKLGVKNKRTKLSSKNDKIRVHKLRSKVAVSYTHLTLPTRDLV